MHVLKKFLGEGPYPVDLGQAYQQNNLALHYKDNLCIVHVKTPIPHQDESQAHAHESYEFTASLNGAPRLLMDKKAFVLPPKMIVPCNPEQYHGPAEKLENESLIALQFDRHYLQDISKTVFNRRDLHFKNTPQVFDSHLKSLIQLFMEEDTVKQKGHEFILDSLSTQIAIHFLRALKSNLGLPTKVPLPEHRSIKWVLDYLRENYNNDFTLEDLAREAGLSKYYLARVFKEHTGKTLWNYLRGYRIQKAKELLHRGKHTVTEVCFLCGFQNHSYFTRCFQQEVGCTPTQYKNNNFWSS